MSQVRKTPVPVGPRIGWLEAVCIAVVGVRVVLLVLPPVLIDEGGPLLKGWFQQKVRNLYNAFNKRFDRLVEGIWYNPTVGTVFLIVLFVWFLYWAL